MANNIFKIFIALLPVFVKAQVNINVQMPPAGLVQKDQLWNLVLVSNNQSIQEVTLRLNLQDASTGQVVLSATTGNLMLNKGVTMIKAQSLQPINYTYNIIDFSRTIIPMGAYIACYQVIDITNRKEEPIAEECLRITVDPLAPPMLATPTDKSTIATKYPQFTWMPPAPLDMFGSVNYDIVVTEVLEGQSATEAVQYNTPIYTRQAITKPLEGYPSTLKQLDTGKQYAWQIVAKNGLNYAAKTDVWTFKIAIPNDELTPTYKSYININYGQQLPSIHYCTANVLNIKYYSFEKENTSTITIKTNDGKTIVQSINKKVIYGDNFFDIKLSKDIIAGNLYILEIESSNGVKFNTLFSPQRN